MTSSTRFVAETQHVQTFSQILEGFRDLLKQSTVNACFNIEFKEDGMRIYGQPQNPTMLAKAFWNKDMFHTYEFKDEVDVWINTSHIPFIKRDLRKNNNVETLRFVVDPEHEEGLILEYTQSKKTGGSVACRKRYWEQNYVQEIMHPEYMFDWTLHTGAYSFYEEVEGSQTCNVSFIELEYKDEQFSMESITDLGIRNGKRVQLMPDSIGAATQNDETKSMQHLRATLMVKHLKTVVSVKDIGTNLEICFNGRDSENRSDLIQFTYPLDNSVPQSHMTFYVMITDESED